MSYVKPQLSIFQTYAETNTDGLVPLHSCIIGPKFGVHRYTKEDQATLGEYDKENTTTYEWPDRDNRSTIMLDNVKITAEDALISYYNGSNFSVPVDGPGGTVLTSDIILQSTNSFSRDALFGSRDVTIGDKVIVSWDTEEITTFITQVKGALGSEIKAAVKGEGNQASTTTVAPSVDSNTVADGDLSFSAGGVYDNLINGVVSETYVCTVIKAGGDGVAEFSIASASGKDDVSNVVVNYASTNIGTKGVTLTTTDSDDGVFEVGETITMSAQQEYSIPAITEGGSYQGTSGTNYIVVFTEGGVIGTDTPKYKVLTNNGADTQAEINLIDGANVVGNYGLTVTATNGDQICKGDLITINVVPQSERAHQTLHLADYLTKNNNPCTSSDTITVKLCVQDTVEIPSTNYNISEESIIINASSTVEDVYTGLDAPLTIISATLYVDYLERQSNSSELGSISDINNVEDLLGPVIPENELAYGVYKALQNSNETDVYFINVPDNTVESYKEVLDILSHELAIYSLVPLTKDEVILNLVKTWILNESSPFKVNWKKGFFNSNVVNQELKYSEFEGTITDESGDFNYNTVTVTGGKFLANDVRAGDTLKFNFRPDQGDIYDEVEILEILTEDTLILKESGIDAPADIRMEVWTTISKRNHALNIGKQSTSYSSSRIHNIWPDVIANEFGEEIQGYFLCAAIAGLTSGVAPHQPISNVELVGFSQAKRSLMFNEDDLDVIAEGGTWIVTADNSGMIHSRHQLSTDMSQLEMRESSIQNNWDSVSREVRASYGDLPGQSNVSNELLKLIKDSIVAVSVGIESREYDVKIGKQIQGYKILHLAKDPVLKDKIKLVYKPILPRPLNSLEIVIFI